MSIPNWLEKTPTGILIKTLVQPKASKSEIVGPHGEPPRLKIRVAAPPIDGEANDELLRFLKKTVRIPGVRFELIRGQSSKQKDILCVGAEFQSLVNFFIIK
ncbi:MAG: DUF167 domain-containing protein [Bdellovibrionota bacterium]